ncbi:MAG: MgtC/SapB family protein, partial [Candidatus Bathyarchaeota archaeon]|nr:MgtC/SapB family protein [Candidatus Bathyarchaeota archaeon]
MNLDLELVARVILGFILSGIVGLEREVSLKPAGLRTHILVGLGST